MKRSAGLFLCLSMSVALTLVANAIPRVAQAAENVLILTDNSSGVVNGNTHISDLIAAFTNTGATVTTNSTELTNGSAMPLSLVSGWDAVIVATVSGSQIDAGDIPVIQSAVTSRASSAFLFFTDACAGCARGSANSVISILNTAGGWSASLGNADNSSYVGTLTGQYGGAFTSLPTIVGTAYSPLLGVPLANVIYTTNAPGSPGPSSVVAPGTSTSACVFMATDVTPFWVSGGISPAQANGLATAYLNTAMGCPLPVAEPSLDVTIQGYGSVTRSPNHPFYPPGTVVQLTAMAANGNAFVGWSGDATGTTNPISITMDADKHVTAAFGGGDSWFDIPVRRVIVRAGSIPVRGGSAIRFELPTRSAVDLKVFDLVGRIVADLSPGTLTGGNHEVIWDGRTRLGTKTRPGIYFIRLRAAGQVASTRVLLAE